MDSKSLAAAIEKRLGGNAGGASRSRVPGPPPRVPDHELLARIGGGSYGDVWLARSATGQLRAIKVVWRHTFSSDRPYEREYRGIAQFEPISRSHPGVVNVLHVGRDDTVGFFFYVMDLADPIPAVPRPEGAPPPPVPTPPAPATPGGVKPANYAPRTLASDLRERGRLAVSETLTLGVQLADALGHIHRHGLVHRDVKPSNVIFVHGQPKLADIGLVTGAAEARSFVGTEGFIPPEGPGTVQGDVFALGRLLYETATGKDRCEFPELPVDLERWPDREPMLELNEVLTRACAPDPKDRHANAAELASDLNVLLAGRSIRRTYGIERRLHVATRLVMAAVVLVALALGGGWFQQAQRRRADARAEEESALRLRAQQAELQGREQLRAALLQQARALTSSSELDRRAGALAALRQAASIQPGLDLRNAALAALATPELRLVRTWSPRADGSVNERPDATLRRYFRPNADGSISVRSCTNDLELIRLPPVGGRADYGVFSRDGRWLAAKYRNSELRAWNLEFHTNHTLAQNIWNFTFSPGSDRIAATDDRGQIHVFRLNSGTLEYRLTPGSNVTQVTFHPTEPLFLVIGAGSQRLEFRHPDDGSVVRTATMPALGVSAAWSADGRLLLTAHADHSVQVWDWPALGTPRLIVRFHRAQPVCLETDPRGRWLATAGWDNQAALFDLRDGRLVMKLAGGLVKAAADRPSFLLGNGATWNLFDLEAAFALQAHPVHETHQSPRELAFSRDERWLATAGQDGIRILNRSNSRVLRLADDEMVHALAFDSEKGHLLALTPNRLRGWSIESDAASGEPRATPLALSLDGDHGFRGVDIRETGITADGQQWLATAAHPESRRRWWVTGRFDTPEKRFLAPLTGNASSPSLSPDGRWLAWGGWQVNDAYVADFGTNGRPLRLTVEGSAGVRFSPDGRQLVLGGSREIRFYDTASWRLLHALPRVPAGSLPPKFAFSADSRLCAAVCPPDGVLLLDVETGLELATLTASQHILAQAAFSPDDRHLAVTSMDHHVLIWELDRLREKLRELALDW